MLSVPLGMGAGYRGSSDELTIRSVPVWTGGQGEKIQGEDTDLGKGHRLWHQGSQVALGLVAGRPQAMNFIDSLIILLTFLLQACFSYFGYTKMAIPWILQPW
jgi:hypothetical protein